MIDSYITEKRCKTCGTCKPVTAFYARADAKDGHQSNCKKCSSARGVARYQARKAEGWTRRRNVNRVEPLWPLPTYTLTDSLGCIQLRKWRGPVSPPPEFRALGARL